MILTIGNTKGGVGKSTIAVNLAAHFAHYEKRVWLVDTDKQGSAELAIAHRFTKNLPPLACARITDPQAIRHQVPYQASNYDVVIIDAGGRDSMALRAALVVTDAIVIPVVPRSFDLWAVEDLMAIVRDAEAVRGQVKRFSVINCADPTGIDNGEAAAHMSEHCQSLFQLGRRKEFSAAAAQGMSTTERKLDPKAVAELEMLACQLSAMMIVS